MTGSYQILPSLLEDIPALVKLVNSAYRGKSSKKGWTTEADLLEGTRTDALVLASIFQSPSDTILKCCDTNNRIVACVHLQEQDKKIYLQMLTVSPEMQTAGIGKKLLIAAEEYATDHACHTIVMTVISVRHELIEWYERRGFTRTGQTKPFPKDSRFGIPKQELEFILMEKIITGIHSTANNI